ncbi:hypothetical protein C4E24_05015 [ANME-1 cluster archaeon AG-394-G21]|nr:hypothetical protein [ANME-1 cluster archaeon AG-394-G21]
MKNLIFIKSALMDDRALRATIGLSASEFNQLAQGFGPEIEKNILITDIKRWIGYLSPPEEGKKHDYGMFKGLFPPKIFPKGITLWLDLGFTGVDKDYPNASIMMPKKKSRGKELTDEEKANNN